MDRVILKKGFKRILISLFLCFIGPITVSQAFNNEDHPFFLPIFFFGLFFLIGAIGYGSWGILTITKALLKEEKN